MNNQLRKEKSEYEMQYIFFFSFEKINKIRCKIFIVSPCIIILTKIKNNNNKNKMFESSSL